MNKKILVSILAVVILAFVHPAEAQQPKKILRIGVLRNQSSPSPYHEAFRRGLRELRYVEGKNIIIETRWTGGKADQLQDLAANLVNLKVDVIVAGGAAAARAAQQATSTIPIVTTSSDPIGIGLVSNLARPGGNITGLSVLNTELSGKRLEILKETIPGLSRLAILSNPTNPASVPMLGETESIARLLGVHLQLLRAPDASEFKGAFSAMIKERAQAVIVLPDATFNTEGRALADLAAKSRLPSMFEFRDFVEDGGLMSYGVDLQDLHRRVATYVDKILKGTKPGDLPIEQPTKFEFVINLKTAKQIGLTIPPNVLARADKVIK